MALVQYTAIVNQARGKLNGSVFNRSRTAYTLGRKQQPPRSMTGQQAYTRSNFSALQRGWKSLSPADKALWDEVAVNNPDLDRFGEPVVLAGYNKYMQSGLALLSAVGTFVIIPDPAPAPSIPSGTPFIFGQAFSLTPAGRVRLQVTASLNIAQPHPVVAVDVSISRPVSPGVRSYYGSYYHIGGYYGTGNALINVNRVLGERYPMPVAGQRLIYRTRMYYYANGVRVAEWFNAVTF